MIIRDFARQVSDFFKEIKAVAVGDHKEPKSGQVCLINSREVWYPNGQHDTLRPNPDRPRLVVLVSFRDDFNENPFSVARVRPISRRCDQASPLDLCFTAEHSPFGLAFMVQCWNPRPMLRYNLLGVLTQLDGETVWDIDYLNKCELSGTEPDPSKLRSKGTIGPPILSEKDPRIEFQNKQFDLTDFLSAPMVQLE